MGVRHAGCKSGHCGPWSRARVRACLGLALHRAPPRLSRLPQMVHPLALLAQPLAEPLAGIGRCHHRYWRGDPRARYLFPRSNPPIICPRAAPRRVANVDALAACSGPFAELLGWEVLVPLSYEHLSAVVATTPLPDSCGALRAWWSESRRLHQVDDVYSDTFSWRAALLPLYRPNGSVRPLEPLRAGVHQLPRTPD